MVDIKILDKKKLISDSFIYLRCRLPIKGKTHWEY